MVVIVCYCCACCFFVGGTRLFDQKAISPRAQMSSSKATEVAKGKGKKRESSTPGLTGSAKKEKTTNGSSTTSIGSSSSEYSLKPEMAEMVRLLWWCAS